MQYWLVKTEPETYSYTDLESRQRDRWNGVRNFSALKNIRRMQPGDQVFVYHTGKEKAIVGLAQVVTTPYPDPDETDPRLVVVDLEPQQRLIPPGYPAHYQADPFFQAWELVNQPRLSVMPVPPAYWTKILQMTSSIIRNSSFT